MRERNRIQIANHDSRGRRAKYSTERRCNMTWIEWSALLALALALVLATLAAGNPSETSSSIETRTVRVRMSETLWEIAQTHPVPGNSTAQTVEVIRALNDMNTSTLHAEQLLEVPVCEDTLAVAAR